MAVALDQIMTAGDSADTDCLQGDNVVSKTGTITLGAAATFLTVPLIMQSAPSAATGLALTWNGVSMTAGPTVSSGGVTAAIFVIVNPTTGAHSLSANWTNQNDIYMGAASFTGTDTSTGFQSADNKTVTNSTTISCSSDANGATVAVFGVDGGTPTLNFNKVWDNSPFGPGGGSSYQLGGTLNNHTFTGGGGTVQALAGLHVIATSAAVPTTPFFWFP